MATKTARKPRSQKSETQKSEASGSQTLPSVGVGLTVPLLAEPLPGAYIPRHVDTRLAPVEAGVLKRLALQLELTGARLPDGTHVTSTAKAVRWLLNALSEAA